MAMQQVTLLRPLSIVWFFKSLFYFLIVLFPLSAIAAQNELYIGNSELRLFLESYRKSPVPNITDIPMPLRDKYFPSVKPPLTNPYGIAFAAFLAKKLDGDLTRENVVATIQSLDGSCYVSLGINPALDTCRVKVWDLALQPQLPSEHNEQKIVTGMNIRTELLIEYSGSGSTDKIEKITILDDLTNIFDGLEKYEQSCHIWEGSHTEK